MNVVKTALGEKGFFPPEMWLLFEGNRGFQFGGFLGFLVWFCFLFVGESKQFQVFGLSHFHFCQKLNVYAEKKIKHMHFIVISVLRSWYKLALRHFCNTIRDYTYNNITCCLPGCVPIHNTFKDIIETMYIEVWDRKHWSPSVYLCCNHRQMWLGGWGLHIWS